ncbi:prepilin peptidase [Denitratisoma oestradiolicum]|uniref:Prepilin leader peptidase/N-methyltransferase n=1 Tax=Denitratisoma oestradiolicum TaxID=311182 RepID=A0A6S6XX62_9PROT|nr:A24 family peptidase [Denitratisoma oestradiolicum]TWO79712.1 prepilin peptidase [Denitratisoma oestradiolicum]CAB1367472.1 Leader peptidase / N-methyltransferase [Denitratisoma oestradiolicum]
MEELLHYPGYLVGICSLLGLIIGSFLNVVIHRLPKMMENEWARQCAELRGEEAPAIEPLSLSRPASHCPDCGHAISALENIPLLSWLLLGGRCRACRKPISPRYPLVEALTGALFALAAWKLGSGWPLVGALFFLAAAVALTFIDFDTQLLPDDITLPLLWAGLLFNLGGAFTDLSSAVIGAAAGYLSLWLVYWAFKLATGKEGMGHGDFKLLAAIGAWLGWQMLPLTILFSSFVGALVGILLIVLARHGRHVPIPFGPYLATAGVIALFWGPALTRAWLGHLQ